MVAGAVGAAWSAARGWLTPAVLFVAVNLVVGAIAVASRLMSSSSGSASPSAARGDGGGGEARSLLRSPSVALDRLRCFSFSRLGLSDDHDHASTAQAAQPAFGDGDAEPSGGLPAEEEEVAELNPRERGEAPQLIGRSRSEAAAEAPAARRRPRARRTRNPAAEAATATATEETAGGRRHAVARDAEPAAVEVDERADDFIRRFREELRMQRLDSMLRRTGTA